MSKKWEDRRRYRIGDFEYLLDDEDRTAWISEGNSGGAKVYTMPENVEIEGVVYTITSVEIGAYGTPQDASLEEVWFPTAMIIMMSVRSVTLPSRRFTLEKDSDITCIGH